MAQALCARSVVAASLASPVGLPKLTRGNGVRVAALSKRLTVCASLKKSEVKSVNKDALATTMAASFFSLLATAPGASAAQMVAELADDTRPLAVLGFLIPALGWVLFNIAKPALNQLDDMTSSRSFVGAMGISAAAVAGLLMADDANAAQLVAQVADDKRIFVLGLPVIAALGWVLFNITGPAINQLRAMLVKRGVSLPTLAIKTPSFSKKAPAKGTVKGTRK